MSILTFSIFFFFSSRRRHTRYWRDWSSDVCSSDLRALVELFVHRGSKVERAAVVSDVRGGDYFETFRAVLDDLGALGLRHRVLFLDADEQTLLTRYKETRRRHPAAPRSRASASSTAPPATPTSCSTSASSRTRTMWGTCDRSPAMTPASWRTSSA